MFQYIFDPKMTLPEIHDQLDRTLGHARYEKESSIWSKILDALDDSDKDDEKLRMVYNAERQKYFVSAVHLQCKRTHKEPGSLRHPTPVLLLPERENLLVCDFRPMSIFISFFVFYLVLQLCLYAESRAPEGLHPIQRLQSPEFDLDVSFFNLAI
jgi:hypothetical protein